MRASEWALISMAVSACLVAIDAQVDCLAERYGVALTTKHRRRF